MIEINIIYRDCHGANSFRPNQFYRIIKIDDDDKWATETELNNANPAMTAIYLHCALYVGM